MTKTGSNKAIFFDRDGTLIQDKVYLNDPSLIEYLPGVFECLRDLQKAGYKLIVVTNQSGVARGLVSLDNLNKIHEIMTADFAKKGATIDAYYYAPYSVESNHPLRKPNPGMLLEAAKAFDIDLSSSYMVGDRDTDIEAGHRAGTKTVFITTTFPECPETPNAPHFTITSILDLRHIILGR